MDSFPQFAAELETEEAISIPLSIPTSPFSPTAASPSREIFVRPRGGNIIAIVEKSSSNGNTDTEWKYLNLENDFVLPLHVASELNRPVWKVRVGYFQGGVWDDYPFHTRDGAFKFQQLVTGYKPVETFENVTCLVTYKAGLSLRRPQYAGFGTVQVWREADKTPKVPVGGLSMMSSRSSGSSQSLGRPTSIASIQSNSTLVQNYEGQSVLVVQKPRPPLLVAFLKDKSSDEAYASLKVDSKSSHAEMIDNVGANTSSSISARPHQNYKRKGHPHAHSGRLDISSGQTRQEPPRSTARVMESLQPRECKGPVR